MRTPSRAPRPRANPAARPRISPDEHSVQSHDPSEERRPPPRYRLSNRCRLPDLGETEAVARRITESRVDAVGAFLGLLGELDAAALELLIGGVDVVGREEDRPREALRHEAPHLLGCL